MQMQHIHAFVMLCQEKNISRCSRKLHISQQGLSRQIKTMEEEIGSKLFIRNNKGVTLTEEGKILLPELKKVWEHYNKGMHKLADYQKNYQETIRISVCPGIKQALGLGFFKEFQNQNPNICLKLEFRSDMECEEALYQGKADAAFLDWPIHEEEYYTYLVVKSPLVAVMRKDHALSRKKFISMSELAGMNVYIPDESHRMSQRFVEHWPEFYKSVIIDFTANEYESFYRDLPKSGGVALTFRFLCHNLDSELIAVPVKEESFVALYYCTRKNHSKSIALNQFSNYIRQNIHVYE